MSQIQQQTNPGLGSSRNVQEEAWFADQGRESKRPLRVSPTSPPPPIGDDVADRWFR